MSPFGFLRGANVEEVWIVKTNEVTPDQKHGNRFNDRRDGSVQKFRSRRVPESLSTFPSSRLSQCRGALEGHTVRELEKSVKVSMRK